MERTNEDSQTELITLDGVDSRESLIAPNRSGVILKVADLDTKPSCRICYGGPSREKLLKPCKCKGTIQYVHRQCLERWLEEKNIEACELCQHKFETRRTRKSCWDWFRTPELQSERRNFIGDCTCFAFLTPLAIATFWLCTEGAIYYLRIKNSTLETIALVTLAVFLVVAYFTWITLCARYHIIMYTRWRERSWHVRIVEPIPSDTTITSSTETYRTISSEPGHDSTGVARQQVVKYTPTRNEADEYWDFITIALPEITPPDSDGRDENKHVV